MSVAGADGKVRKSVPAEQIRDHYLELADLRALAKDVSTMLSAQRLRLERLLMDERSWEPEVWRERHLDHGSVIARPLIWQVVGEDGRRPFVAPDGDCEDVEGSPVSWGADDRIELWHPALVPTAEAQVWRVRIEEIGVVQPFKQAHREIYVLTDAERRRTYSNRFAGHMLRQHSSPPSPARAAGPTRCRVAWDSANDARAGVALARAAGRDTGRSGRDAGETRRRPASTCHVSTTRSAYRSRPGARVATSAASSAAPLLRGACATSTCSSASPASATTHLAGRRPGAAATATTGSATASATSPPPPQTRGLLDTAAAAAQDRRPCALADRFLVVRGDLRTYKIHLGSGNILMEPNDQYLCIVPDRGAAGPSDGIFLPSRATGCSPSMLSKAFLLANDRAIKDQTITSQITRR